MEDSDLGRPHRHGDGHCLLEFLIRRAKLPCNCKAVLRSRLAARCQGSPQRDQMLRLSVQDALCVNLFEKGLVLLDRLADASFCLRHPERGLLSGPYQYPLGVRRTVEAGFFDKLNPIETCIFHDRQEILSR
jgi:hypothetical protein